MKKILIVFAVLGVISTSLIGVFVYYQQDVIMFYAHNRAMGREISEHNEAKALGHAVKIAYYLDKIAERSGTSTSELSEQYTNDFLKEFKGVRLQMTPADFKVRWDISVKCMMLIEKLTHPAKPTGIHILPGTMKELFTAMR